MLKIKEYIFPPLLFSGPLTSYVSFFKNFFFLHKSFSHLPTSITWGILSTSLYILGVCGWVYSHCLLDHKIPYPLSIVFVSYPNIPASVHPVSIFASSQTVLLPSLTSILVIPYIDTSNALLNEFSTLVAWPSVIYKADVIYLHLYT